MMAVENSQDLLKPPRGYQKYCFGESSMSSVENSLHAPVVIPEEDSGCHRKIENFTYIDHQYLQENQDKESMNTR